MNYFKVASILLTQIMLSKGDFQCKSTADCMCIKSLSDYYYECPSIYTPILRIHVIPGQLVEIDCLKVVSWENLHIPTLRLGNIKNLVLESCPFGNVNFSWLLEQLGINEIENFTVQYSSGLNNITLETFENINGLQTLSLHNNNVEYIEKRVFDSLKNLTEIILRDNKFKLTSSDLFANLTNLKILDLAANKLNDLPEGIFENMRELKILHLWANKLKKLDRKTFENLPNLEILELSRNLLQTLPEDVFVPLKNLTKLSLAGNDLKNVPATLFSENLKLESIKINMNPSLTALPAHLFANLTKLQRLHLDYCKLTDLHPNLFDGCANLKTLSLHNNELEVLHENLFKDLSNLETLDLGHNKLLNLPDKIFWTLKNLISLNLESNALTNVSDVLFYNQQGLERINLRNNSIGSLSIQSFQRMVNLKDVVLSHNQLRFDDKNVSPFVNNLNLEVVDVSHNGITYICTDFLINKIYLKELDLSYNNLTSLYFADLLLISKQVTLNLNNNKISAIDFRNAEAILKTRASSIVDSIENVQYTLVNLNNNPFKCDCKMYDFIRYYEKSASKLLSPMSSNLLLTADNFTCSSPAKLAGTNLSQLKSEWLSCPVNEIDKKFECPPRCDCEFVPGNKTLIFDCGNRNLTKVPELSLPTLRFYELVEVNLRGNSVKSGPNKGMGYENVTKLILSDNDIEEITWLPSNLHTLKLENNKLNNIHSGVLPAFNSTKLKTLTLGNNPWNCDCATAGLIEILLSHLTNKEIDINQIKCTANGTPLIYVNSKDLCSNPFISWSIIFCAALALIIFLLAVIFTVTKRKPSIGYR